MNGVPHDRKSRDQRERHAPLPRGDERRREAKKADSKERRAKAWPQALAKMKQAPGDPWRQGHVMALDRMREFEVNTFPPTVQTPDRRQHEEKKGADGDGTDGPRTERPPLRSRRRDEDNRQNGKGQDQRADIFRSGRAADEQAEQDGAVWCRLLQQSDQRREREQEEGRDEDILLGADAAKLLSELVPGRSAERIVDQVKRHRDREYAGAASRTAAKVAQDMRTRIAIPASRYCPRPDRLLTRFVQQWLLQSERAFRPPDYQSWAQASRERWAALALDRPTTHNCC